LIPGEVIRATTDEKEGQLQTLAQVHHAHAEKGIEQLVALKKAAISNQNVFERLMEASKYCSLGQLTHALYEVGGQYRRNM